ncbi:McrB family protein [Nostoc sp.]|uniref:McrB family protein n=1 Tax=Nostoc sp. TaxID=1180 RepID=UPI002FF8B9FF
MDSIRPQSQNGILAYPLVPGRFLEFCKKAESREDTCVLIIDEINRANLAQVFGELMYLLEYRDREIPLAGGNTFRIPENVRIIGTMNTADRSIANIDHALRRRFAFIELRPNYKVLRSYHQNRGFTVEGLINILQQLNQAIADKNYEIGISFFLTDNLDDDLEDIWRMEIEPYLEEYFFNELEKVENFRWKNIKAHLCIQTQQNQ